MINQTNKFFHRVAFVIFPLLIILLNVGLALAEDTVCLQCHAGQPGHLSEPIGLWEMSIHKENGISCHDCHGGDPTDFAMAMSPERGFVGVPTDQEIPAFCGKCHVGVKEDYDSSAHGQALGSGGPHCVTCHSNHKVEKASLDLINETSCSRCHEYGRAAEIKAALSDTDSRIGALEVELKDLHDKGISTREMEGKLFALRNEYHQLFHSVDESEKLPLSDQGDLGQRKVVGGVIVVLLIFAGILLLMLKKTYEGRD